MAALVTHSIGYLFGRGAPSIINLAALGVYTQLIGPDEYGEFALVHSVVLLADVILFQWVRLALLRFGPMYAADRAGLLSTITAAYVIVGGGISLLALASAWLWAGGTSSEIVILGLALFWIHGWFHLDLELARSDLAPARFAILGTVRAVCVLLVSVVLVKQGLGPKALLLGSAIGTAVPMVVTLRTVWRRVRPSLVDYSALRSFMAFGLPLSVTFALSVVISKSDRLMLGWLDGVDSVGAYAAAYDLTHRTVVFPLLAIAFAGYPLMIRAMEEFGASAAREQVRENGTWLLALGIPAALAYAMLSENIASSLLGADFQSSAVIVMPWIAVGVFFGSFRNHFFDHSFHLSRRLHGLILVTAPAALLNVVLNLWLIPRAGIRGAAYATLISYLVSCVMSAVVGRRHFPLPWPWKDMTKILVASLVMALVLMPLRGLSGWSALLVQLGGGGATYLGGLYALNVAGIRWRLASRHADIKEAA